MFCSVWKFHKTTATIIYKHAVHGLDSSLVIGVQDTYKWPTVQLCK